MLIFMFNLCVKRHTSYWLTYLNSACISGRAVNTSPASECASTPSRLCKTRYNTTAPMYGVSLTSGQPVTIVQKFPDLLQQVVFEVYIWHLTVYLPRLNMHAKTKNLLICLPALWKQNICLMILLRKYIAGYS